MTLFYDYSMLFIEKIYDTETFVIFFSNSSKQGQKVIISKDLIWSSYIIHSVGLHHYKDHHHHHHHHYHLSIIMQQSIWKLQYPLPSPQATTDIWSICPTFGSYWLINYNIIKVVELNVWTCPLLACRNDVGYWSNEAFKCYCGSFFIHSMEWIK